MAEWKEEYTLILNQLSAFSERRRAELEGIDAYNEVMRALDILEEVEDRA